jgi:putative serine protease PepD
VSPAERRLWTGDRPQSDLEGWAAPRPAGKPEPDSPSPPPPEESQSSRRLLLTGAGIGAGLVVLGVILGVLLGGGSGEPEGGASPLVSGGSAPRTTAGKVYAAVADGVVSVRSNRGSGTGFVLDRNGTLVTNAHVVGSSDRVRVRFGDAGRQVTARVLGSDGSSDLAVLKVDPRRSGRLRALRLGDSGKVSVGDDVVAVGHPFGLDRTATAGIVSGVGREIKAPNGYQIDEVIQTDAPINPGNSGGPLVDARGRVIGVNSQIATAGAQGNLGIGFAVPSSAIQQVVPKLSRGQTIARPYLGIVTAPVSQGAEVREAEPSGPGGQAGIQPGDKITSVAGRPVRKPEDVAAAITSRHPGERVKVQYERDGKKHSAEVTLGRRPERPSP